MPASLRHVAVEHAPPETAVLTQRQAAAWLQLSVRQLDRLEGIPYVRLGQRSRRYSVRAVLEWMKTEGQRRGAGGTP